MQLKSHDNEITYTVKLIFITMHAPITAMDYKYASACTPPTTDKIADVPTHLTVSMRISPSSPLVSVDNSPPSYIQLHHERYNDILKHIQTSDHDALTYVSDLHVSLYVWGADVQQYYM